MKHIDKKRKSKKLRADTLKQLKDMRAVLEKDHPELMRSMRTLLKKIHPTGNADKPLNEENKSKNTSKSKAEEAEFVTIDRQKNLEAILKYASTKPASDKLKKELKDFLN